MTDLMDRLAAANPALEQEEPPIDDLWRKIAASDAVPARTPWWRAGGRAVLIGATAVPVIAVIVLALSGHRAAHGPSRAAVTGVHRVRTTIDPAIQRGVRQALNGRIGSVVVLDPRTGAVKAMAATGILRRGASVPPGATFDVVTAAAALSSGRYRPLSQVSGASPFLSAGSEIRNDDGESVGRVTLSDAMAFSVNTVFARVGVGLGPSALTEQTRLFRLDAPPGVAVARLAAGQSSLTATPLQMAMLAAAVANRGWLAEPHIEPLAGPAAQRPVMSAQTAQLLTQMLRRVVTHGTATAANVPGLRIAGKTGTAHARGTSGQGTVASFIGFAPADHPTVAIAVVLADSKGGFGGTTAAPIAAHIIRRVLSGRQ
jgi:peptidoglycan glycosyltransferase